MIIVVIYSWILTLASCLFLEIEKCQKYLTIVFIDFFYLLLQCFDALRAYMLNESPTPLLLVGGAGSGKSTILSKWYVLYVYVHNLVSEEYSIVDITMRIG